MKSSALVLSLTFLASIAVAHVASAQWQGPSSTQVSCESINHQAATCNSGFSNATAVTLIQQYSTAGCTLGKDFQLVPNSGSFWVANGCRGLFQVDGY